MGELVPPAVPPGRLRDQAQPRLNAGAFLLRPWEPADAPRLAEAYGDPAIQRWHVRSMSEDEARDWVAERRDRWQAEIGIDWAVEREGEVVGRVNFREINLEDGRAEAGYWVLASQRGGGIAAIAVRAATTWMFSIGFHRLELLHSLENEASCRVADAAGYRLEGTQRGRLLHADGWHDAHVHVRLEGDAA
jgi:RimJ/RimL family protein N-acetyltransferase